MTKVNITEATNADMINIYGYVPDNDYYALNCFIDNKFVGIGGWVINDDCDACLFLNVKNLKHKFSIAKILIKKIAELKNTFIKFTAIRDVTIPNSDILLQKLGFKLSYICDDNEVWELINGSNGIQ